MGVTTGALRYRSGQAVALLVLSTLAVAACAFGPLYERAVEQAQLKLTLNHTPVSQRGFSVLGVPAGASADQLMPNGSLAHFYQPPVTTRSISAHYSVDDQPVVSSVVSRTGLCQHLRLAAGRCPSRAGEVAASVAEARALHLTPGRRLAVQIAPPNIRQFVNGGSLVLTGTYQPYDPNADYWFGHKYYTDEGYQPSADPLSAAPAQADSLLAADGTIDEIMAAAAQSIASAVTGGGPASLVAAGDVTEIDAALRTDRVQLDTMAALRSGVAALVSADRATVEGLDVETTIDGVLVDVNRGRHQASTVVPAFAVELALLVLVVVCVVVVTAADQRRPEFALARLRGRSSGRAAGLLEREFLVPVLVGVVPGLLLAWGCGLLAGRWWLSGSVRPEARWPVFAAAAGVVVAELLIVAVVARRAARRPVHELLRRVPQRSSRFRLGAAETALAAIAIAGVVVTLSGDRHNALAVALPAFLALLVGMVLGRLLAWGAQAAGRRALWRGRLSAGIAYLQIGRRPGLRYVVVLLCLAAALIVSAADQWRVAARNRAVRAGAEVGASTVLTVRATDASTLEKAVAAADPGGGYATPVVVQNPVNGAAVMAVEPDAFRRIAAWGWASDHPTSGLTSRLQPHRPAPITITGTTLRLRLRDVSLRREPSQLGSSGKPGPVALTLNLRTSGGGMYDAKVGPIPAGSGSADVALTASVPCAKGCQLQQLQLLRDTADTDPISLDATLASLEAGPPGALRPVDLGPASNWKEASSEQTTYDGHEQIGLAGSAGALGLKLFNEGSPAIVQHLSVPVAVPALLSGGVPDSTDSRGFLSDNNIDGVAASFAPVGRLPLLPGAPGPTMLVDLDTAASLAGPNLGDSTAGVWLRTDDPGRERVLVAALAHRGVSVLGRDTAAAHRTVLAQSAPAWAMQLALVSAVLAVLIAAVVILMSATAARRSWAYDMSALELVGVSRRRLRRAALLEQVTAAIVGVLVGSVTGLVGAHLALPGVPMFLTDVPEPAVLRPTAWTSVGVAAALALVALVAAGVGVGLALVRQVAPQRVQEGRP